MISYSKMPISRTSRGNCETESLKNWDSAVFRSSRSASRSSALHNGPEVVAVKIPS